MFSPRVGHIKIPKVTNILGKNFGKVLTSKQSGKSLICQTKGKLDSPPPLCLPNKYFH